MEGVPSAEAGLQCIKEHPLMYMTEPFERYVKGNLVSGENIICSVCID